MERGIVHAKEAVDTASNQCSRVAQAMLTKGPVTKLAPLLKEAKASLEGCQPLVAKAATLCVGELDGVIEQLRNNARRCRADVDGLLRANEETGGSADDASRAIATANNTLNQAEQQLQQVCVRVRACVCACVCLELACDVARSR